MNATLLALVRFLVARVCGAESAYGHMALIEIDKCIEQERVG